MRAALALLAALASLEALLTALLQVSRKYEQLLPIVPKK
jgi:hypothetical protein